MKYLDVGCNINCWECDKKCDYKKLLEYSIYIPSIEPIVYSEILERLKAQAGLLILNGVKKEDLDEEIKILSVSFYVAKLKMKEQLIPKK